MGSTPAGWPAGAGRGQNNGGWEGPRLRNRMFALTAWHGKAWRWPFCLNSSRKRRKAPGRLVAIALPPHCCPFDARVTEITYSYKVSFNLPCAAAGAGPAGCGQAFSPRCPASPNFGREGSGWVAFPEHLHCRASDWAAECHCIASSRGKHVTAGAGRKPRISSRIPIELCGFRSLDCCFVGSGRWRSPALGDSFPPAGG